MTDFKKIATAVDPPIPPANVERVVPSREALEKAFAPLVRTIPAGTDVWTGPEDVQ